MARNPRCCVMLRQFFRLLVASSPRPKPRSTLSSSHPRGVYIGEMTLRWRRRFVGGRVVMKGERVAGEMGRPKGEWDGGQQRGGNLGPGVEANTVTMRGGRHASRPVMVDADARRCRCRAAALRVRAFGPPGPGSGTPTQAGDQAAYRLGWHGPKRDREPHPS